MVNANDFDGNKKDIFGMELFKTINDTLNTLRSNKLILSSFLDEWKIGEEFLIIMKSLFDAMNKMNSKLSYVDEILSGTCCGNPANENVNSDNGKSNPSGQRRANNMSSAEFLSQFLGGNLGPSMNDEYINLYKIDQSRKASSNGFESLGQHNDVNFSNGNTKCNVSGCGKCAKQKFYSHFKSILYTLGLFWNLNDSLNHGCNILSIVYPKSSDTEQSRSNFTYKNGGDRFRPVVNRPNYNGPQNSKIGSVRAVDAYMMTENEIAAMNGLIMMSFINKNEEVVAEAKKEQTIKVEAPYPKKMPDNDQLRNESPKPTPDTTTLSKYVTKLPRPTCIKACINLYDVQFPTYMEAETRKMFSKRNKRGEKSKIYVCDVKGCTKTFTSFLGLKYHEKHGHTPEKENEERPYVCHHKFCFKKYKNSNGLKYHLKTMHFEK